MEKNFKIVNGNSYEELKKFPDNYFDSVVTDPPYGLGKEPDANEMLKAWIETGYMEVKGSGFMGKEWDAFVPQPLFWKEVLRVLKHGGHVIAFYGTRTYDWGVMAMRLAGFEIRDQICWNYSTGFPKSHNIINEIKKDLKCKVEKQNVTSAIKNLYQLKEAKEMDGQNIVVENVLLKIKKKGVLEFVSFVKSHSIFQNLMQKERTEESKEHFVLLNVSLNGNLKTSILKIILIGEVVCLSEKMDTLVLTLEKENINLNTILLWKNNLEENLKKEKMFTTLTEIEQTIELKICNYFLNPNIQKYIANNHSALKPSFEPIVLARKPLERGLSIAENVLKLGTGGINIDGCRIGKDEMKFQRASSLCNGLNMEGGKAKLDYLGEDKLGRFPANFLMSHHPDCEFKGLKKVKSHNPDNKNDNVGFNPNGEYLYGKGKGISNNCGYAENGEETIEDWNCNEDCPIKILDEQSGVTKSGDINPHKVKGNGTIYGNGKGFFYSMNIRTTNFKGDSGGASRFFYVAKASKSERNFGLDGFEEKNSEHDFGTKLGTPRSERIHTPKKNNHPTVKPVKLMQYLVRMITPPNGKILDPFNGSGTTGIASVLEGFEYTGIEMDSEYCKISEARISAWNEIEEYEQYKKIIENQEEEKENSKYGIQGDLFN
jgi:DNA modification methylase